MKRVLLASLMLPLLLGSYFGFTFYHFATTPTAPTKRVVLIEIPKGSSLKKISRILSNNQIITHPHYFELLTMLKGAHTLLKAGSYRLHTNMRPTELINALLKPIVEYVNVTIPEGYAINQIAALLKEKQVIGSATQFIKAALNHPLGNEFPLPNGSTEGYLFPETYKFRTTATIDEILRTMVQEFFNQIKPLQSAIEKSSHNLHQLVTIASIIEKETGVNEERPLVSSVIYNRLRRKMKLQMDPTVIYGIKNFNGNLTKNHLQTYSPYNTYRINGIPPGPIANPGFSSIKAALYPTKSNVLYFVAKNNGTHIFTKTFAEHQKYVKRYQLKKKL